MEALMLTGLRIALLVVLWLLILFALNAMRVDANRAAAGGRRQAAPARRSGAPSATPVSRQKPGQLTIVEGPLAGSYMDISSVAEVVMGRNSDLDFVLGDDYSSGRHARLFRRGSEWFVEDLESRNGTFVGGYRIDQPERVGTGTDIRMGRSTVRLVP